MNEIDYWGRDKFQSLKKIADSLRSDSRLVRLAEYCDSREKGKRAEAFKALDEFLRIAGTWEEKVRQEMVSHILSTYYTFPSAHQFLAYPLVEKLIKPVLNQWKEEQPNAVEPIRWLGLLDDDPPALELALNRKPSDDLVRGTLVQHYLRHVDFATHHLVESIFLGNVQETLGDLESAKRLLQSAPNLEPFTSLSARLNKLQSLVDDWMTYKKSPQGTFPEWCEKRNRHYGWSSIVYY
jgi:hypothetical protein